MLFKAMPVSIDFMDESNSLIFYSTNDEERAARREGTLGKNVMDCHCRESKAVIEKMTGEFKTGRREPYAFFHAREGVHTRTRYFPVRDEAGNYRGILEISDDITDIINWKNEIREDK